MILNLSPISSEPLYTQIVRQLRAQILTSDLKPGDEIPSIRDLARTHKVSIVTVQRAYEELSREKLINAIRGRGYQVADLTSSHLSHLAEERMVDALTGPVRAAMKEGISFKQIADAVEKIYKAEEKKGSHGSSDIH